MPRLAMPATMHRLNQSLDTLTFINDIGLDSAAAATCRCPEVARQDIDLFTLILLSSADGSPGFDVNGVT